MNTQEYARITENEASVLRTILYRGERHGLGIVRVDDNRISRGSVYYLLRRLEEKGLVESRVEEPGKNPGNPRRMFTPTDPGVFSLMVWDAMQLAAESLTAGESWVGVKGAIELTNMIIRDTVEEGASHIFLKPGRGHGVVGVKIDGVRTERWRLPDKWLRPVLARIKLLARLDTGAPLRRQDGKARVRIRNRAYDLFTAVSPVAGGERCVIRVAPSPPRE